MVLRVVNVEGFDRVQLRQTKDSRACMLRRITRPGITLPALLIPSTPGLTSPVRPHSIIAYSSSASPSDGLETFFHNESAKFASDSDLHQQRGRGCRCGRTNCLKQYCSCFRQEILCKGDCMCKDCYNDGNHEELRKTAIVLQRRKLAATISKGSPGQESAIPLSPDMPVNRFAACPRICRCKVSRPQVCRALHVRVKQRA
jgi:hypothetical protein